MASIQIRNVPPGIHAKLKKRASQKGMSLSEYLLREVTEFAERPTEEEFFARLETRSRVHLSEDPATTIRKIRDES